MVHTLTTTVNRIQPPPEIDTSIVDWSNVSYNLSSHSFDYSTKTITLSLNNLPDIFFKDRSRFSVSLFKTTKQVDANIVVNEQNKSLSASIEFNRYSNSYYWFKITDLQGKNNYESRHEYITVGDMINPSNHSMIVNIKDVTDTNGLTYKEVSLNKDSIPITNDEFDEFYGIAWYKDGANLSSESNKTTIFLGEMETMSV